MKKNILLLVLCMVAMVSCNPMENPPSNKFTDNTYWTNEERAQYVVNMAYAQMYSATKMWNDEALSDNLIDGTGMSDTKQIRNGQALPSLNLFESEWNELYGGIKTCHIFLEKVDRVPNMNPSSKAFMIAQIRFIRAYIYFRLTNFYGDIPFFTKDITLEESKTMSRTPRNTVISFIHQELDEIISTLPRKEDLQTSQRGAITKGAAIALQARVYLMDSDWKNVVKYTEMLMNEGATYGQYELYPDYRGLFEEANEYNSEIILERGYTPQLVTWGDMLDMAPLSRGARVSARAPLQSLVDSYRMLSGAKIRDNDSSYDPNYPYKGRDPRLSATVVYDGYDWSEHVSDGTNGVRIMIDPSKDPGGVDIYRPESSGTPTGYYVRKYYSPQAKGDMSSGLNIIMLRYGDVLLMNAEAHLELNTLTPAIWDRTIGALRKRAGLQGAISFPSNLSQEDLRSEIRNERRVELALEGLRWYDIQRWQIGPEVLSGQMLGATFPEPTGTIIAGTRRFVAPRDYLWSVPLSQTNLNANLKPNNPGYAN